MSYSYNPAPIFAAYPNLTQGEIAEQVGVSIRTVNAWANGDTIRRLNPKIAALLGVHYNEIVDPPCKGNTELFFGHANEPKRQAEIRVEKAKHLCRQCPARIDCLENALRFNERGIWGGTTDEERRQMSSRVGGTQAVRFLIGLAA